MLHHDQSHLFWTDLSIPFGSAASRFNELLSFRHDFDCFPPACERVGLHVYVHLLPKASSHMAMQQQNTLHPNQCSGSALPKCPWKFWCNLICGHQSHSSSCILHALPMFAFALMYSWQDVIFCTVGRSGRPVGPLSERSPNRYTG